MKIFFDSSVVLAALWSETGASAKIIALCEARIFEGYLSEEVIEEIGKVLERKAPETWPQFKKLLKVTHLKIFPKAKKSEVEKAKKWIRDANDAPILASAKKAKVNVLLTLDLKDFIRDPGAAKKSNLTIWTPGEFFQRKNSLFP